MDLSAPTNRRNRAPLALMLAPEQQGGVEGMSPSLPADPIPVRKPKFIHREIKPGEYGNLLDEYNKLTVAMKIADPPPLVAVETPTVGTGAHGSLEAVSITEGTLNLLTPEERKYVLAHELGHVVQQREQMSFGAEGEGAPDKDADKRALQVTRNPHAAISAIRKLSTAHIKEFPEEYHRINPGVPLTRKTMHLIKKQEQEMLNWRIANIKSVKLSGPITGKSKGMSVGM